MNKTYGKYDSLKAISESEQGYYNLGQIHGDKCGFLRGTLAAMKLIALEGDRLSKEGDFKAAELANEFVEKLRATIEPKRNGPVQ